MIEAVDFSIDLENGEYLAHVMLFNIEDTIIEYCYDPARDVVNTADEYSNIDIDTPDRKIEMKKYFKMFHEIITKNIGNNITRVSWHFYTTGHLAYEIWWSYVEHFNVDGLTAGLFTFRRMYERIVLFGTNIGIDDYMELNSFNTLEVSNILPSKFIKRSLGE